MALNPDFLLQILDKIGVPLTAAVEEVSARDQNAPLSEVEEAKIIAQLIGQTIQVILPLSGVLYQGTDEQEADSIRLGLAAIAAPLVAGVYKTQGRAPDENDIKRLVKSMEATLAFSENFNPAADQAVRLKMLGENALVFDTAQTDMSVLSAMVPVVNAIGEFSFGQSETKFLQDVTNKLMEKAASFAKNGDKLAELSALKSLASLYAQCHMSETARLSKGGDENREELSLDPVWNAFDARVAMVGTILDMAPMAASAGAGSSGGVAPAAQQPLEAGTAMQPPATGQPETPTVQTPASPPPVQTQAVPPVQPTAPPAQTAPPAGAPPQGGGGPMSFFTGGNNTAPPAQAAPPAGAPPPVQPQTAPPAQPAAAPTTPPPSDGNPMSFFKGPPKTDDQSGQ